MLTLDVQRTPRTPAVLIALASAMLIKGKADFDRGQSAVLGAGSISAQTHRCSTLLHVYLRLWYTNDDIDNDNDNDDIQRHGAAIHEKSPISYPPP